MVFCPVFEKILDKRTLAILDCIYGIVTHAGDEALPSWPLGPGPSALALEALALRPWPWSPTSKPHHKVIWFRVGGDLRGEGDQV